MRIINSDIVSTSCFNTMDGKDVNGGPVPVTDLKFSPSSNDATNSNGILSPPTTPSTATPSENDYNPISSNSNSGRLKFYKDGKIILELLHHKNGEGTLWIPVPKNSTCWPPVGHYTPRQESSTSLSVSDDNSSVQSSPWQRDHCWKQAVPRKNISRKLEFMMHIPASCKVRFSLATIRRRRRRPYDTVSMAAKRLTNASPVAADDVVDGKLSPSTQSTASARAEAKSHLEASDHLIRCSRVRSRRSLSDTLQKLLERRTYECTTVTIGSCRTDPGIVSPRKRILKEMEKVSLEEMGNANKKHRARTVFSGSGSGIGAPCNTVAVISGGVAIPAIAATSSAFGGLTTCVAAPMPLTATMTTASINAAAAAITTSAVKSTNSHSISSILSRDEEQPSFLRNLLKSPTDACAAVSGACGGVGAASELSSSSSSSSVGGVDLRDAMRVARPAHSSTPIASSLASPPPLPPASSSSAPNLPYSAASSSKGLPQQQQPPPPLALHPPSHMPTYIPSAYLYGAPQPFLASPPVSNHPPYYPAFGFRDTGAWPVPSISSLGRQSVYPSTSLLPSYPPLNPSSWVPVPHPSLQSYPVSENGTDVPLNLSKH